MSRINRHRQNIFAKSGGMCIYCGGVELATSVDHMPPRIMFDLKDRPSGLEFAACEPCNSGAGRADLVAALIGRVYPDSDGPAFQEELRKLLLSVHNNVPGLIEELLPHAAQSKHLRQRYWGRAGGDFLSISGPLATSHLERFGARLGLAMHFEETGEIVGKEGCVFVRIFSNTDLIEGYVPQIIFEILQPSTLAQGRKSVGDQFRYGVRKTDGGLTTMSFALFRRSFAVLAITTASLERYDDGQLPEAAIPYRPGALQCLPLARFSAGAAFRLSKSGRLD